MGENHDREIYCKNMNSRMGNNEHMHKEEELTVIKSKILVKNTHLTECKWQFNISLVLCEAPESVYG